MIHIYHTFIIYMYCIDHLGQLAWLLQKLSFTVSTLLSWNLHLDRSDLIHFHGKGCDFHGPIMANHPKFMHKVVGCHLSTPKFTQDLQSFSKFQVPNHQFSCEVSKRGKGLAVQKPGKAPNRQISNLRLWLGFSCFSQKSQKRTSRNIIKCQEWGRFVRNPFSVWGYIYSTKLDSTWRAAHHFPSFHSKSDIWIHANSCWLLWLTERKIMKNRGFTLFYPYYSVHAL